MSAKGTGQDYDYINVPMALHAVDDGYSDVLCGNGNFCGRNTTGPGICCKYLDFNENDVNNLIWVKRKDSGNIKKQEY